MSPSKHIRSYAVVGTGTSGGGPAPEPQVNPLDEVYFKIIMGESNAALSDAALFAMLFPETNAALTDALQIKLALADSNLAPSDLLLRLVIGITDSNISPTDALALRIAFADNNVAPTDILAVAFTLADTNPTLADNLSQLSITMADTNLTLSEALSMRIAFGDSNVVPTDTSAFLLNLALSEANATPTDNLVKLSINIDESNVSPVDAISLRISFPDSNTTPTDVSAIAFTLTDTNPAVNDVLTRLAITHQESNLAPTDNVSFLLQLLQNESNAAATDLLTQLSIAGLNDNNAAPTDSRSGLATWRQGATTAASTGSNAWTNPANAQGLEGVAGNATSADTSAIATWTSALTLSAYPDPDATFSSWTITSVKIVEYAQYTAGTLPAAGSWVLEYRITAGGAFTALESLNASFNSLAAPKTFDVTNTKPGGGAWTWADINAFNAQVRYNSALAETSSAAVDAIVLEVVASKAAF